MPQSPALCALVFMCLSDMPLEIAKDRARRKEVAHQRRSKFKKVTFLVSSSILMLTEALLFGLSIAQTCLE